MKNTALQILIFIVAVVTVSAQDSPSWAVTDAINKLISKNALFQPGRDGFVKLSDGRIVQFELPSRTYEKVGKNWRAILLSKRKRIHDGTRWLGWQDARPTYSHWNIGEIQVEVLTSGVAATWMDGNNFLGGIAPSQAEITQKLNTAIHGPAATPVRPDIDAGASNSYQRRPALPSADSGIFRKQAGGTLQRVTPPTIVPPTVPSVAPPVVSLPPGSFMTLENKSPHVLHEKFVPDGFPWAVGGGLLATLFVGCLLIKWNAPGKTSPASPVANTYRPPTISLQPPPVLAPAPAPEAVIRRRDNLMTPAELAFFGVLEPLIRPRFMISAKVRLADLFAADHGRGFQSAFNKISSKHIDFVIADPTTSRILCGIELDDESHQRADRVERDRFVNDLFAQNRLPLLRVPFSWKYYPQAICDELAKAGIYLKEVTE